MRTLHDGGGETEAVAGVGAPAVERVRIVVRGAVQGVGFRPHVWRVAHACGVGGWVTNDGRGVLIEAEGTSGAVERFMARVHAEAPASAEIAAFEFHQIDLRGDAAFAIRESVAGGAATTALLADLATCAECLREVLDPHDRRHGYPFANCTRCGPRYSIVEGIPWDRARTTMRAFAMCAACRAEYENPADRRFHAEAIACAACGPRLELRDAEGATRARREEALAGAIDALRDGRIVAVKGLGGFHLMVDATNAAAVARLRARKHRPHKPFAVMFPDLDAARRVCAVDAATAALMAGPRSPIVLVRRRGDAETTCAPCDAVAPGNPLIGALLPYTPLHHLLMRDLARPVVATSGNISGEPLCFDNAEAIARLGAIADVFLKHDRPIARPVDDSVVRPMAGGFTVLRAARGFAPYQVGLGGESLGDDECLLGAGGHLKNAPAFALGNTVHALPHLGDLATASARETWARAAGVVRTLYGRDGVDVAHDAHPDYAATRMARDVAGACDGSATAVQHHHAHVVACMAEHGLGGAVLGVAWDGTGLGPDGTIWGGEFLVATRAAFRRVAHLRPFRLPGGERAIEEPWRAALGVLEEIGLGDRAGELLGDAIDARTLDLLRRAARAQINAPVTTSAGRLFDAIAALLGLRPTCSFEGQAAMDLEFLADRAVHVAPPCSIPFSPSSDDAPAALDWEPMVRAILDDRARGVAPAIIAARFHAALADAIVAVARHVSESRVVLTGGCFQNARLLELAAARLVAAGFAVHQHRRVPPNDGGLAVGQVVAAAAAAREAR